MNLPDWETNPAGCLLVEELEARGWTVADLVRRMGPASEYGVNYIAVEFLIHCGDYPGLELGEMSRQLGQAFGVSPGLFDRLHQSRAGRPVRTKA